MVTGY